MAGQSYTSPEQTFTVWAEKGTALFILPMLPQWVNQFVGTVRGKQFVVFTNQDKR
jgi:hypothetical protein